MEVVIVVGFLAFTAVAFGIGHRRRVNMRAMREGVAAMLQHASISNDAVLGRHGAVATQYVQGYRGSGKHRVAWTEVRAEIPAAYPLSLLVRPHGFFDPARVARGEMVDVTLGDEAFDTRFLVEAAPADVVRAMLDPDARRALLAITGDVELVTTWGLGGRVLQLSVVGWLEDLPKARYLIDTVVGLAGRVRASYGSVEAATALALTGDPYRPILDDAPRVEAARAREAELANLATITARRYVRNQRLAIAVFVIVLLGAVALGVLAHEPRE